MKKNLKRDEEKAQSPHRLALKRETILTLADPLLELAQGGYATSSGVSPTQVGHS